MKKFAVLGWPVEHSLSPMIHQAFAQQFGHAICYERLAVTADDFPQVLRHFFTQGGAGCNVTMPHKESAYQLADQTTPRADIAGSANTLWVDQQGSICADNTDGVGLVDDLQRLSFPVARANILVIGAGGATRGLLAPILAKHPRLCVLTNRTFKKAQQLAARFSEGNLQTRPFQDLGGPYDLIINATSSQYAQQPLVLPSDIVSEACALYDLSYCRTQTTDFIRWGQMQGCVNFADGLGMLIHQAAHSYRIWQDFFPEVHPVFQSLRGSHTLQKT